MKKILALIAIIAGLQSAQAQITNTLDIIMAGAKDWVAIPYFKYNISDHEAGYGGAILYKASPNFYTGLRFDSINGQQTTAGVQAQLQVTITVAGLAVTPFIETSVGIGNSDLYGSAGPGALVQLYHHDFGKAKLNLGLVGDFEHVVNGNSNYDCYNVGPLVNLSF